jgi:hypothetical protein
VKFDVVWIAPQTKTLNYIVKRFDYVVEATLENRYAAQNKMGFVRISNRPGVIDI